MGEKSDGPAAINRYATGIARGGTPDVVFHEAFGKTSAAFEKDLRAYVHGVAFKSRWFTFPKKVEVDAPVVERSVPAAQAADLQLRVGRIEEATRRIESAATGAPDAAFAHLALAR